MPGFWFVPSYTLPMRPAHIPWIAVLLAAISFLIADQVWNFQFGLRTYWPLLIVLYVLVRLLLESQAASPTD